MNKIDRKRLERWYDLQAPCYSLWRDRGDSPLVRLVAESMHRRAETRRVLDAGCGTGLFSIGLAREDSRWSVVGIDMSEGMLAVARKRAASAGLSNLEFRRGNVERLPWSEPEFDVVVAAGLFPNLERAEPALGEFRRVLHPGGRLVVVEFDREAMTAATRGFFHVMILGYRVVSRVLPRYRFARRWNIEASTIDRARFEQQLDGSGFTDGSVLRESHHLLFDYGRAAA